MRYVDGKPKEIDTVVLSTQHSPEIEHGKITEAVIEEIIKPVLPNDMIGKNIKLPGESDRSLRGWRPAG